VDGLRLGSGVQTVLDMCSLPILLFTQGLNYHTLSFVRPLGRRTHPCFTLRAWRSLPEGDIRRVRSNAPAPNPVVLKAKQGGKEMGLIETTQPVRRLNHSVQLLENALR